EICAGALLVRRIHSVSHRTSTSHANVEKEDQMVVAHSAAASDFLYEQLAAELGQAIERGALRPGERLPSVRRLAEDRAVSVATVLQAYLRLENAGLIEVRPKSGHFVRRRNEGVGEPRAARKT